MKNTLIGIGALSIVLIAFLGLFMLSAAIELPVEIVRIIVICGILILANRIGALIND